MLVFVRNTILHSVAIGLMFVGGGDLIAQTQSPTIKVPAEVIDGDDPNIRIVNLIPKSVVRLHAFRSLEKWANRNGSWNREKQGLHAWADYRSDENGTVAVSLQKPLAGVYESADALALLRDGYPLGHEELDGIHVAAAPTFTGPANRVYLQLQIDGQLAARDHFDLVSEPEELLIEVISESDLHGVYASPQGSGPYPAVIALHGSEGGSVAKARGTAARFAANNIACLAVNYFAYEFEGIDGLTSKHINIPIETLQMARDWLVNRKEISSDRISLYGVSKGAEFALLGASKFDWIRSVVAVVPSDVVWAGYGDDALPDKQNSSWSYQGNPLPFVPLFPFEPTKEGMYRTNTERYSRSRQYFDQAADPARIPIENATCRILLLAGDRDEVWASGEMSRNLNEKMVISGKSRQLEMKVYPLAGHQIAGTGTFPIRLYGRQSDDPSAKDLVAEGQACADAWKKTLEFLTR